VLTVICSSYSYVAMVTVRYKETISIMFQERLQIATHTFDWHGYHDHMTMA